MAAKADDVLVTGPEACRYLKLSRQRLAQLVADGVIRREAPNKYRLIEVVHGYLDFMRDERSRANKSAADSRVRDARAQEIALRIGEKLGHLVAVEEFDEFVDAIAGIILSELGSLPARFTRDLGERRRLEAECNGILERLSKHCQQTAERVPKVRKIMLAFADTDAGSMGGGQQVVS